MQVYPKPIVVVSKCLEFDACRYDGEIIFSAFVKELKPFVEFMPVCPEVEIGLGIPRPPINIYQDGSTLRLIQPQSKTDLTQQMQRFVQKYLAQLSEVDGFLLKSKSPSCGVADVKLYSSLEDGQVIGNVSGFFATQVLEKFSYLPVVTEVSIQDYDTRQDFLERIFRRAKQRKYVVTQPSS